jgi:uncharacterized protein with PQ loop repeat
MDNFLRDGSGAFRSNLAVFLSVASVGFIGFAQFHQIYINYRYKSLPGLSPSFMIFWLAGDFINLVSCLFSYKIAIQSLIALYLVLIDLVSVLQILWIKYHYGEISDIIIDYSFILNSNLDDIDDTDDTDDTDEIDDDSFNNENDIIDNVIADNVIADKSFSLKLNSVAPILVLFVFNSSPDNVSYILVYVSSLCFILSRLMQIIKNQDRQTTRGLSSWMFISMIIGNVLYIITLFVLSEGDSQYIIDRTPWLISSIGTLILDMVILLQCYFSS